MKLDWYDYGARFYDPQLGRFTGIDPIAEKFYHVTTYNYAENSPISNIDLWGLQKLFFQKALNMNQSYKKVNDIQRKTTGGKSFAKALKSQNKYNAFYYEFKDALPAGKHNAFENRSDFIKAKKNDSYGVFKNLSETDIEAAFENGKKSVIAIGIEKVTPRDVDNKDRLGEKVFTLNHEEVAHGKDVLTEGGNNSGNTEDHKKYFGESETYSPTYKEVLTNEKYEGTKARKQAEEINTLIEEDKK